MKTAQSRQKSYDDRKRQPFLNSSGRVSISQCSAIEGRYTFWEEGQAESKVHRTFGILERVGEVAYKLALPSELAAVHNVFHVSMLRKYASDPSHVLVSEPIEVQEDLTYQEQPVQILDRKDKALRNKVFPLVKVLWRNHKVEEAT